MSKKWEEAQRRAFLFWVNSKLAHRGEKIEDVETGFSNGLKLISLAEVLSGKKIEVKKYIRNPDLHIHKITNCFIALKFFNEDCHVKGITTSAEDLVSCKQLNLVLGLCWILLRHFQTIGFDSANGTGSGADSSFEKSILKWLTDLLKGYKDLNFDAGYKSESFQNGKALLALLNEYNPNVTDYKSYDPTHKLSNCKAALENAEKYVGLPADIIDPEELSTGKISEKNLVLYLSLFENAFKEQMAGQTQGNLYARVKELEAQLRAMTNERDELLRSKTTVEDQLKLVTSENEQLRSAKSAQELAAINAYAEENKKITLAKQELEDQNQKLREEIEKLKFAQESLEEQLKLLIPENEEHRIAKEIAEYNNKTLTKQLEHIMRFLLPKGSQQQDGDEINMDPVELEKKIKLWIQSTLNEKFDENESLFNLLQNGAILCRILNAVKPGTVKHINDEKTLHVLKQLENVKGYLGGCWDIGIEGKDMFVPKDLSSKDKFNKVIHNLVALNKLAVQRFGLSGELIYDNKPTNKYQDQEEELDLKDLDSIPDDDPILGRVKRVSLQISRLNKALNEATSKIEGLENDKNQFQKEITTLKENEKKTSSSSSSSQQTLVLNDAFVFGQTNTLSHTESTKTTTGTEMYFDSNTIDPAIINALNTLIRRILSGVKSDFDFTSAANYKNLLTVDTGRRLFVHLLRRHMGTRTEVAITDDSMDALLFLVNLCLSEMSLSGGADFITAQGILDVSPKIKTKKLDSKKKPFLEELTVYIKDHQIWKDNSFWEDYFWHQILHMPEFKKIGVDGFNKPQQKIIASQKTGVPAFVRKQMWGWGSTKIEDLQEFSARIGDQAGLNPELLEKMQNKVRVVWEFKS
eukprot:TRINITY_DN3619_c0_g1_i1.p1 TRINITY_DN3619_c0_g1~~TRINITY_DN3619_c0_g1_i1.p1  ORF type:complete len:865 (-),score=215.85 TRINITY_DN3619_c0_g1_i1:74-2668(-)